ncbi:uncharacterized mitochondrial protein AtMg00810-like [Aristolochia californica]|uniref:uncharacterized mitochondrial protein AtMg00810-like n=1 Tax=Aristolochia californica TaxID=171875 RepID=UPI0035E15F5E
MIVVVVYADDTIIIGSDFLGIQQVKENLNKVLPTEDFGLLIYFISIKVLQSSYGIVLSLRKYVFDLIKETWVFGCKLANVHKEPNVKLCVKSGDNVIASLVSIRKNPLVFKEKSKSSSLYKYHGYTNIKGFVDTDWAGSSNDRKSTSDYCTTIGELDFPITKFMQLHYDNQVVIRINTNLMPYIYVVYSPSAGPPATTCSMLGIFDIFSLD